MKVWTPKTSPPIQDIVTSTVDIFFVPNASQHLGRMLTSTHNIGAYITTTHSIYWYELNSITEDKIAELEWSSILQTIYCMKTYPEDLPNKWRGFTILYYPRDGSDKAMA